MKIATAISLIAALLGTGIFAWRRQWVLSLAWSFSLAYTIFSKLYPTVLPEQVVTLFSVVFLALVLLSCFQTFRSRNTKSEEQ